MTNLEAYNEMMNDMVDINFVFDVAKANKVNDIINNINNMNINNYIDDIACLGLVKVKVNKGRKWKGEGWLVGHCQTSFSTGYRNIYTKKAKIYDPITNKIETIAFDNVTIIDTSAILEAYKKTLEENIYSATIDDLGISYIIDYLPVLQNKFTALNIDILNNIDNALSRKNISISSWAHDKGFMNTEINLENAVDEIEDTKKAKKAEFKEKKMAELIEWVKNNTDKKGEEINKLAERIFNKKYEN